MLEQMNNEWIFINFNTVNIVKFVYNSGKYKLAGKTRN